VWEDWKEGLWRLKRNLGTSNFDIHLLMQVGKKKPSNPGGKKRKGWQGKITGFEKLAE